MVRVFDFHGNFVFGYLFCFSLSLLMGLFNLGCVSHPLEYMAGFVLDCVNRMQQPY